MQDAYVRTVLGFFAIFIIAIVLESKPAVLKCARLSKLAVCGRKILFFVRVINSLHNDWVVQVAVTNRRLNWVVMYLAEYSVD